MYLVKLPQLLQVVCFWHSLVKESIIMTINMDFLYQSLELMVLGMAGVFLVLGILYASAIALLKIFPANK